MPTHTTQYCYRSNLSGSTVHLNEARRTGGGIFNREFMNLTDSVVENNEATFFPDIFEQP
ncbi:MAG: hypothetical protein AAF456_02215 [Planctomycetota bacterium]